MKSESNKNAACESRAKNVRHNESRVSEMECHVQELKEKLRRLENMLPQDSGNRQQQNSSCECDTDSDKKEIHSTGDECSTDEIARKEKFLRKQIYDMECTEQKYMHQIADMKRSSNQKISSTDQSSLPTEKDENEIARERLSILEGYSKKLCNNLQCLEKNHVTFTQEAENLTQVLNTTRKANFKKSAKSVDCIECAKGKNKKSKSHCAGKIDPKCDSCDACSCDECNRDLQNQNFSQTQSKLSKNRQSPESSPSGRTRSRRSSDYPKLMMPNCNNCVVCSCNEWQCEMENKYNEEMRQKGKKISSQEEKCCCYEEALSSSSSSDSSTCACRFSQTKSDKKTTESDSMSEESESSYCSSDVTCYCSKNESHDDLVIESNSFECNGKTIVRDTKVKRCRGGFDTVDRTTTVMNIEKNSTVSSNEPFLSVQNSINDHLKLMKVDELREGLERLKIRNRNLKDFLHTLETPMNILKQPSEATSFCTEVSSCVTLDLTKQSRSGLLTVVKVLEGKCRNKDAIIIALADELKAGGNKKLRLSEKQLEAEKAKLWKNLYDEKHFGRKFTKKDSAIGFVVFIMILISHVKRSEMISYFCAVKKILTNSPFQLIRFINESDKFSTKLLPSLYKKISRLHSNLIESITYKLEKTHLWLSTYSEIASYQFYNCLDTSKVFIIENQNCILSIVCFMFIILLVSSFKKFRTGLAIEIFRKIGNLYKSITYEYMILLRIALAKMMSSRIFWLTVGFICHILWNFMKSDFFRLVNSFSTYYSENITTITEPFTEHTEPITIVTEPTIINTEPIFEISEIPTETMFDSFYNLNYSCIMSMFNIQFQDFLDYSYWVLKKIVV